MLWQRFGRGARDKEMEATVLLFTEPKDLDPVDASEGRKRKAPEKDNKAEPKTKRARKEKQAPMVLDTDVVGEEEFWKARKEVYHEPIGDEKKSEINQVLDDVINAEGRGICCRRKPFKVYFDDEDSGLCTLLFCSTLNNILQESAIVTTPSTGLVLAVHRNNLVSAATSAIQKSLKTCFGSQICIQNHSHAGQKSRTILLTITTRHFESGSKTGGERPARIFMEYTVSSTSGTRT